MVTALIGVAAVLGDFGLSMASIQSKSLTQGQRSNLFWLNAALGVALALLVFLLSTPISLFYGRPELVDVTRWLSLVFLLNALAAQFKAEVSRLLKFKWMAIVDVVAQAAALIAALAVALNGGAYWALVVQQLAVAGVTFIMAVIGSRWIPGRPRRRENMRSLLTFGLNTTGSQLINYASSNADSVVLGRFWGTEALGVYDRAYQIFRLPLQQIAAPMTRVAFPILSKIDDGPTFDRYIQRAQLILTYVLGTFFFFAAAAATPLLQLALGPGWDGASTIFTILAIGGVFQALGYVYYWIFLSKAMTGLQLRYTAISRLLMVGLICAGGLLGPFGVAIGASGGLFLNWLILTIFAIPRTGVNTRALVASATRPLVMNVLMFGLILASSFAVQPIRNALLEMIALAAIALLFATVWFAVYKSARSDLKLIIDAAKRVRGGR